MGLVIERAKPDDARAIIELKRAAWFNSYVNEEHGVTRDDIEKKFSDEEVETGVKNWTEGLSNEPNNDRQATFVARVDGQVAGYTSPKFIKDKRRLGALYVKPEYQGQGIGYKLAKQALEWHGNNDVYLFVVSYNQGAIGLYEKLGFEPTGRSVESGYYKSGKKRLPQFEMVRKGTN